MIARVDFDKKAEAPPAAICENLTKDAGRRSRLTDSVRETAELVKKRLSAQRAR